MEILINKDFSVEECCKCSCLFGITTALLTNLKETKQTFYCPNGHPQSYRKSTAEELREQLKAVRSNNSRLVDDKMDLNRRLRNSDIQKNKWRNKAKIVTKKK